MSCCCCWDARSAHSKRITGMPAPPPARSQISFQGEACRCSFHSPGAQNSFPLSNAFVLVVHQRGNGLPKWHGAMNRLSLNAQLLAEAQLLAHCSAKSRQGHITVKPHLEMQVLCARLRESFLLHRTDPPTQTASGTTPCNWQPAVQQACRAMRGPGPHPTPSSAQAHHALLILLATA